MNTTLDYTTTDTYSRVDVRNTDGITQGWIVRRHDSKSWYVYHRNGSLGATTSMADGLARIERHVDQSRLSH